MEKTTVRSAAREISYTAMFVAIIAVCAWIRLQNSEFSFLMVRRL